MTMRMIGRNCGVYFEDDLLIWPEGDRPGTALHSSCGAPAHDSDSHYPHAMASSGQLSLSRCWIGFFHSCNFDSCIAFPDHGLTL